MIKSVDDNLLVTYFLPDPSDSTVLMTVTFGVCTPLIAIEVYICIYIAYTMFSKPFNEIQCTENTSTYDNT